MEKGENKPTKAFQPNLNGREPSEVGTQLAVQRTGLSFQRTRLGADRTLMAVIRTSLSLISFGFTIFHFFEHFKSHLKIQHSEAHRYLGFSLTILGIATLILGIAYHSKFMLEVRAERDALLNEDLLPTKDHFPISMILIIAIVLLVVGIISLTTMILAVRGILI